MIAPRNTYVTSVFHFAATSYTTNGAESAFSSECVWSNTVTNGHTYSVTLAWDKVTNGIIPDGYRVYEGKIAFQYGTNWDAGNTNQLTVNVYPVGYKLNHYYQMSWRGRGMDIWASPDLKAWSQLFYDTNSFMLTNPPGPSIFWKATNITQTNWFGL